MHTLTQFAHALMVVDHHRVLAAPTPPPTPATTVDVGNVVNKLLSAVGWWIVPILGMLVAVGIMGKSRKGDMAGSATNSAVFGFGLAIFAASSLWLAFGKSVVGYLFGA